MPPNETALEAQLLRAHAEGDKTTIAQCYARAADVAEAAGDANRACFFLTQGWIYALEAGLPLAQELKGRLIAHGREVER